MEALKWKDMPDGGATLKTNALTLVVRPHKRGGWDCCVYNSGCYKRLYESATPALGDLAYAKRHCQEVAFYVLRDEQRALADAT